jgi:hypothetical protein
VRPSAETLLVSQRLKTILAIDSAAVTSPTGLAAEAFPTESC